MYEEIDALLEKYGWILSCYSPLEIEMKEDNQSTAAGYAVKFIIDTYKKLDKKKK